MSSRIISQLDFVSLSSPQAIVQSRSACLSVLVEARPCMLPGLVRRVRWIRVFKKTRWLITVLQEPETVSDEHGSSSATGGASACTFAYSSCICRSILAKVSCTASKVPLIWLESSPRTCSDDDDKLC